MNINYSGKVAEVDTAAVTRAVLKGFLFAVSGNEVNQVNAPALAANLGIQVTESRVSSPGDFTDLIELAAGCEGDSASVAGTFFGATPRIVKINDRHVEARPEGVLLLIENRDRPGLVGLLGQRAGAAPGEHRRHVAQPERGGRRGAHGLESRHASRGGSPPAIAGRGEYRHRASHSVVKLKADSGKPRGDETLVRFIAAEERSGIPAHVTEAEWSAAPDTALLLHHENLLCIGLGARAKVTAQTLRSAAAVAARLLQKAGRLKAAFDLRAESPWVEAAAEGAVAGGYRFQQFKATKQKALESLRLLVAPAGLAEARRATRRGEIIGQSTNLSREIGNLPGNILYPETLAARAREVAAREKLAITVLDENRLRSGGFGGIMAVGAGSARPPRLIVLRHRGGRKDEPFIALAGKAITFDTGGISIKPAASLEDMIFDKCGGMAVLGAMAGIARLKLKRNVVGIIAAAENMPSATAYRPGDIVKTYDGTYVEIVNTDAEGRMVLADAIAYARRDCRAQAIVDLATLTGASVVALGEYAAGLWSNTEKMQAALLAASGTTGERVWPLPLYDEYSEQIKSEVAGLKNTGGRLGGACTAAAFLKSFAGETPWAHLDIAPVAHTTRDRAGLARGATGFGTRLLIELVAQWEGVRSTGSARAFLPTGLSRPGRAAAGTFRPRG